MGHGAPRWPGAVRRAGVGQRVRAARSSTRATARSSSSPPRSSSTARRRSSARRRPSARTPTTSFGAHGLDDAAIADLRARGVIAERVMKVGLTAYDVHPREFLELAAAADEAGFSSLWLGEHVVLPSATPARTRPSAARRPAPHRSDRQSRHRAGRSARAARRRRRRDQSHRAGDRHLHPPAPSSARRGPLGVHGPGPRRGPVHVRPRLRLAGGGVHRARRAVRRAGHPLRGGHRSAAGGVEQRRGQAPGPALLDQRRAGHQAADRSR